MLEVGKQDMAGYDWLEGISVPWACGQQGATDAWDGGGDTPQLGLFLQETPDRGE